MHKHFRPLCLAAVVAAFLPHQANAQGIESLTLRGALARALQQNPEIRAAQSELAAAGGAVRQAGALPNPELTMMLEDRDKTTRTTTWQLSQLIELGGKRGARIDLAQRRRDAAELELAIKRDEVRAMVISTFHAVLAAQERHALALSLAELANRAALATAKRVDAGRISPVEQTKARVAASSARLEVSQAKADLASARQRLSAIWGGSAATFGPVAGMTDNPPALPELAQLEVMLSRSPLMERARLEVAQRQAMSRLEQSRRPPDLTLTLGSKRDEQLGRSQAIVGLSLPLPLFDRNQGNVQEALMRVDKARDEISATDARLRTELIQTHTRLAALREEVSLLRDDMIPGAQSAYDAALKGFDHGKFNFLDVLDAQRTLFQARSQYWRASADAYRAAIDIRRMTGTIDAIEE